MQKLKRALRTGILYIASVVLISSPSMAAFAAEDETYTYDPASGRWNSSKWVYDAKTGVYVPADAAQTPPPSPSPSAQPTSPENDDETTDTSAATIANSGPDSNNEIDENTDANSTTNINNGTEVDNKLDSDANTGNAGVTKNTAAGDAQSGDANVDATIVNSVHSTVSNGENSGIAHFTIDLYGDVHGDIVIGPSALDNATVNKNTNINSQTNIDNSDSITNDIDLSAKSGDAEVSGNTTAGSAKSGNATAVANLLNLVNTVIAANKSFVGTINIHGNMYGDILMSPEFIPQLLGSNATATETSNLAMATHVNDDKTIVNNVDLAATSGTATVKDNSSAGSANTGDAQTNLQILNLTGHEVVAENAVLVFVNVKGKWVGLIMDAPGATAAAFGSGVLSNTVNANNTTNINNKTAITNNVKLSAQSGNATVSSNTSGGDATTGDAYSGACIANIIGSKFILSGFFAVLCINIDEDFYGRVLPRKDTVKALAATDTPSTADASNVRIGYIAPAGTTNKVVGGSNSQAAESVDGSQFAAAILASTTRPPQSAQQQDVSSGTGQRQVDPFSVIMMVSGFGILGGSAILWAFRRYQEYKLATAGF